jgi:hypothetical protein
LQIILFILFICLYFFNHHCKALLLGIKININIPNLFHTILWCLTLVRYPCFPVNCFPWIVCLKNYRGERGLVLLRLKSAVIFLTSLVYCNSFILVWLLLFSHSSKCYFIFFWNICCSFLLWKFPGVKLMHLSFLSGVTVFVLLAKCLYWNFNVLWERWFGYINSSFNSSHCISCSIELNCALCFFLSMLLKPWWKDYSPLTRESWLSAVMCYDTLFIKVVRMWE